MIRAAALCPGPPLLVPELTGADAQAARVRAAARAAVAALLAAEPDAVAVVGADTRGAVWPAQARVDLTRYGMQRSTVDGPLSGAPLSVGMGGWLLDDAGYAGPRVVRTVGADDAPSTYDSVAGELAGAGDRVGLLVIADGTARRTLKAPGYLDPRAEPYDAEISRIIAGGDLTALRTLDPALARELMAPGWPALQVLAAAFGKDPVMAAIHYDDAPFGVGYLVASLTRP